MDTDTIVGADAPAPYALEITAPADTPAALSSHDAAAVLRKLRQKNPDTPPATQERRELAALQAPETESTAQAGESAAETPPPAQTTDTDRQTPGLDPGAAPIEPPRSWTKEDKELFTGLPRATQERLAERERSREGDFLRRQNEAADWHPMVTS